MLPRLIAPDTAQHLPLTLWQLLCAHPDLAGRAAVQGDITDDSTVSALLPSLPLTLQRCPPCPSHGVTARSVSGLAPASTS